MKAWLVCLTSFVVLGCPAAQADAPPAETVLEAKVQVGAYASAAMAEREGAKVRNLFTGGAGTEVASTSRDGKTFFRSLVTGFASPAEASAYCDRLKAAGRDCLVRRGVRTAPPVPAPPVSAPLVTAQAAPAEQVDLICTSEVIQSRGAAPIEIPAAARTKTRYSLDFKRRLMCDHRRCGRAPDVIQSADGQVIKALQAGGATFVIQRVDGQFTWTSPSGAVSVGRCEAAPFSDRLPKVRS